MRKKIILVINAIVALSFCAVAECLAVERKDVLSETAAERDARMKWWRDAHFGMFIHWGFYAVPGGVHKGRRVNERHGTEWIQADGDIPASEYQQYMARFNPTEFDARQWVRVAKTAGMKYIVITAKHHDGFCMWDSKYTDYDIMESTPFKRDPLAELKKECDRQGLRLGFYYSQLDWHHPALMPDPELLAAQKKSGTITDRPYRYTVVREGRREEYIRYVANHLEELIRTYDPAVLFFDGEWMKWWTREDGKRLHRFIKKISPAIIVNNRIGKRKRDDGDYGTPENKIPPDGLPYDWETCYSMNRSWGYCSYKDNEKYYLSSEKVIRMLTDIVSKGGNFLLNVGPDGMGRFPPLNVKILEEVGEWMAVNGEAVYGTRASPLGRPAWGRFTRKPGAVYAMVYDWPESGLLPVAAPANRIKGISLLGVGKSKPLPFEKKGNELIVRVPKESPGSAVSVVKIEIDGTHGRPGRKH